MCVDDDYKYGSCVDSQFGKRAKHQVVKSKHKPSPSYRPWDHPPNRSTSNWRRPRSEQSQRCPRLAEVKQPGVSVEMAASGVFSSYNLPETVSFQTVPVVELPSPYVIDSFLPVTL